MDKSNEKGRARNRYAKLQPLVNRIHEFQEPNPASNSLNHHPTAGWNEHSIDSYAHQLQNNFQNLALTMSRETKVIKNPLNTEVWNSKMPVALFDQSVFSPATNDETARGQRKYKHKNKKKPCRTLFLDLKAELLDILNCVLHIMWSPIVFFPRLFLTLARSSTLVLYNILKLCLPRGRNASQEPNSLHPAKKKLEISSGLLTGSCQLENQAPDLNKFLTKQSSDYVSAGCFVSPKVRNSNTIGQVQTENETIQKELQSLRKKFNLSLEMIDEPPRNWESQGDHYFQYSSRHQNINNVKLNSDCSSNRYLRRFLDYKDCRKRAVRQHQDLISVAGTKISSLRLGNTSLKGNRPDVNAKRLRIDPKNYFHKNEFRLLMKNCASHLPEASGSSEEHPQRIFPKNRSCIFDKLTVDCDFFVAGVDDKFKRHKKNSATLLTSFRKQRSEKFRPHDLPLRPTLRKKSTTGDEEQCEEMIKRCDSTLSNDLKSNSIVLDLPNSDSQPIKEQNHQLTKKLEPYMDTDKDLLRKKKLNNITVLPISLNQYNTQKLVSKCCVDSLNFERKLDFGMVKNETTVSGNLKTVSEFNEAVHRTECKQMTKTIGSSSLGGEKKDLSQSEENHQHFEEKKRTNESGDQPKVSRNGKSRTAEFTNPIDAKSKWIEIKKKFYGKNYNAAKDQPEKFKAQNLSQITSMSQLPAHKIFQYNMQVARARQMGTEPPSAEDIFLEKKTTSPCLKTHQSSTTGSNPKKNDPHLLKSAISTPRCLSHTQSLSQWRLDPGYSHREKQYCSTDQKPKPKPRIQGGFESDRIGADEKTTTIPPGTAQFSRMPATRANSSVSSLNFRNDQVLKNGPRLQTCSSKEKNTSGILLIENPNSSHEYAEKIDSLISFCRYPFSVPNESIDKNFLDGNQTSHKFFDEAAAGDSN